MAPFKIKKFVELDRANLEWFEATHPTSSLWWLLNSLLQSYRDSCEEHEAPIDLVRKGVKRFRLEQDSGFHDENRNHD